MSSVCCVLDILTGWAPPSPHCILHIYMGVVSYMVIKLLQDFNHEQVSVSNFNNSVLQIFTRYVDALLASVLSCVAVCKA